MNSLRKHYWSWVVGWVLLIYVTLPVVRPICEFLKKTTPFEALVNILLGSLAGLIVFFLFTKKFHPPSQEITPLKRGGEEMATADFTNNIEADEPGEAKSESILAKTGHIQLPRALPVGFHFSAGTVLLLILLGSAYGYGMMIMKIPEEKIHFLEYGFLAFLICRALRLDWGDLKSYSGAFFLTFLLGWLDEGIQAILPNRYYQLSDVGLNGISAGLGLLLTFALSRGKK